MVRAVGQATNEASLRGAQEAFTENLMTNASMLRRRLRTDKLKIEFRTLGAMTKTKVAVAYLDGVCECGDCRGNPKTFGWDQRGGQYFGRRLSGAVHRG